MRTLQQKFILPASYLILPVTYRKLNEGTLTGKMIKTGKIKVFILPGINLLYYSVL